MCCLINWKWRKIKRIAISSQLTSSFLMFELDSQNQILKALRIHFQKFYLSQSFNRSTQRMNHFSIKAEFSSLHKRFMTIKWNNTFLLCLLIELSSHKRVKNQVTNLHFQDLLTWMGFKNQQQSAIILCWVLKKS